MKIAELYARLGQPIHVRRLDDRVSVIRDVGIPLVIRHHQDHVVRTLGQKAGGR